MIRQLSLALLVLLSSCASKNPPLDTPPRQESFGPEAPGPARLAPLQEPFKVLLLGDSISIGYTPFVQRALAGRALVLRPMLANGEEPENCAGTTYGLTRLDEWLATDDRSWDVIHFNFGLHDLKHVDPESGQSSELPEHPRQAEPLVYEAQLREITERLLATGARLIFATTTPVPPDVGGALRAPQDSVSYNRIARRVMESFDIPVNDLHAYVFPTLDELQNSKDVHFSEEGSRLMGEEVARAILAAAGLE